jgi:uncharacterized membrane protein YgaE (UPF0421/DUF939 family)
MPRTSFLARHRGARQRASTLTLVRHRAQPAAAYVIRLTVTAVFAYLIADQVTQTNRPVLAPLTALLVVQASLFQTMRTALRRVISVIVGVLIAVAVAAQVAFTWWVLGLLIALTLVLGRLLRLGDEMLEVPISAMLIFAVGSHAAASDRVFETLIGAAAGLIAGLLFAPLSMQPARDAVGDLAGQMAGLLNQMAADLAQVPDSATVSAWRTRARQFRGDIERVDDSLRRAEESMLLNPRSLLLPAAEVSLRAGVETLEHAALTMRVLTRSVTDSSTIESEHSPVRDRETRMRLAAVLQRLARAVSTYGQLVQTLPEGNEPLESDLRRQLDEAHHQQDRLAELLQPKAGNREWPLRGEILAHVDRLRTELRLDQAAHTGRMARRTALGSRRRDPQAPDRASLIRRGSPRASRPGTAEPARRRPR